MTDTPTNPYLLERRISALEREQETLKEAIANALEMIAKLAVETIEPAPSVRGGR